MGQCTLSMFAGDRQWQWQMQQVVVLHPDRLQKWTNRNLMKFSKWQYIILHVGSIQPTYRYILRAVQLESSFTEKCLEVLVDAELATRQQPGLVAKAANTPSGLHQVKRCQRVKGG